MDAMVLTQNQSKYIKKNKVRKNRRSFKRNKVKKSQTIRLVGVNAAGISSKFPSFKTMLNKLSPTIFFLQETKLRTPGKFKSEYSQYEVFDY